MRRISGGPPLPADSKQDDAKQVKEERKTGEVFVHPHHPEAGDDLVPSPPVAHLTSPPVAQMGGQVIEVKTPLTHRDYSHLVDQEVGNPFKNHKKFTSMIFSFRIHSI